MQYSTSCMLVQFIFKRIYKFDCDWFWIIKDLNELRIEKIVIFLSKE